MKSPPFTELEDRFVGQLAKLEADEDRATLAQLRRGLGKALGFVTERDGWVIRRLPDLTHRELTIYALIASLFAQHPTVGGSGSFGDAFRELGRISPAPDRGPNPSVEKRFVALLNSNSEELGDRLRHAVSLLRTNNIAIDWRCLLYDALRWDSSRRWVQINWSRDFWGSRRKPESEPDSETRTQAEAAVASA
ncbi:MAG: type I-E CRISPR-associated protein Cse2/CasB [Planctomycetia bacterium]|nr:type I-E CRISPR-associated protein Cse2/CasB [Planctomycetia bacterium]